MLFEKLGLRPRKTFEIDGKSTPDSLASLVAFQDLETMNDRTTSDALGLAILVSVP